MPSDPIRAAREAAARAVCLSRGFDPDDHTLGVPRWTFHRPEADAAVIAAQRAIPLTTMYPAHIAAAIERQSQEDRANG